MFVLLFACMVFVHFFSKKQFVEESLQIFKSDLLPVRKECLMLGITTACLFTT